MIYHAGERLIVPDDWWTNGYCSIFAYALHKRFGVPMHAILEIASKDKDATLCHAVVIRDGKAYDADGEHDSKSLVEQYQPGFYYPGEASKVVLRRISAERLGDIHNDFCTDDDLVDQALAYIERNKTLFLDLE